MGAVRRRRIRWAPVSFKLEKPTKDELDRVLVSIEIRQGDYLRQLIRQDLERRRERK